MRLAAVTLALAAAAAATTTITFYVNTNDTTGCTPETEIEIVGVSTGTNCEPTGSITQGHVDSARIDGLATGRVSIWDVAGCSGAAFTSFDADDDGFCWIINAPIFSYKYAP